MSTEAKIRCGFRIGNFKAFAEPQQVPIRPLTLIYGANSAGKSSIIHSLLLANQALEKGNWDVYQTKLGGESVDLGGFGQYIHKHDSKLAFQWGMELEHSSVKQVRKFFGEFGKMGVTFHVGFPPSGGKMTTSLKAPRIIAFELALDGCNLMRLESNPVGILHSVGMNFNHPMLRASIQRLVEYQADYNSRPPNASKSESGAAKRDEAIFKQGKERLMGQWERLTQVIDEDISKVPFKPERFFPQGQIPDGEENDYFTLYLNKNQDPLDIVQSFKCADDPHRIARLLRFEIETLFDQNKEIFSPLLERICYLGPLRCYPPRHLIGMHDQNPNWFSGGGQAWEILRCKSRVRKAVNHWLTAPDRLGKPYELIIRDLVDLRKFTPDLQAHIEDALGRLHNNQNISITDQAENIVRILKSSHQSSTWSELILYDKLSKTEVSHRDIGQGISQVLPVLVNALALKNQTIAIEQPELHLHPALQAELGDVFIESALGERSNRFLLESHSEHLLLRIMRRMRETHNGSLPEGKLPVKPCDVTVLYVETVGTRSIVREMPLNERGELIKDWPGGFFEEGLREILT